MKRIVFFLIYNIFVITLFGTDYSFFKYNIYSNCDYFTGRDYFGLSYFYTLKNENKIKMIQDNYVTPKEEYFCRSIYNADGQIIKWETNQYDGDIRYFQYNEKKYLTNFGYGDFKYIYISENQRDYYLKDDFQYRQTIENVGSIYTVTREEINSRTNNLSVVNISTYIYDDRSIQKYQSISFNKMGKVSNSVTFNFQYSSNKNLKKINVNGMNMYTGKETWNVEVLFEYDSSFHLIKILKNDKKNLRESTVSEFSDYDDFGNWHTFKLYRNNNVSEVINRKIVYR